MSNQGGAGNVGCGIAAGGCLGCMGALFAIFILAVAVLFLIGNAAVQDKGGDGKPAAVEKQVPRKVP